MYVVCYIAVVLCVTAQHQVSIGYNTSSYVYAHSKRNVCQKTNSSFLTRATLAAPMSSTYACVRRHLFAIFIRANVYFCGPHEKRATCYIAHRRGLDPAGHTHDACVCAHLLQSPSAMRGTCSRLNIYIR